MNALARFQRDVFQRLLSCSTLATVSIVLSRPRVAADGTAITATTIEQTLNGALTGLVKRGGKAGATIEVMLPNFQTEGSGGAEMTGTIILPIAVREKPLFNMGTTGTRLAAEEIAHLICEDLCAWMQVTGTGSAKAIYPDKNALSYFGDEESADTVNMMVRLTRKDSLRRRARAAKPTVTTGAGLVTLAAPGGATIRYTINGEYPGASEEIVGVETYSAPFAEPASGALLRCVAWREDYSESDVVEVQF